MPFLQRSYELRKWMLLGLLLEGGVHDKLGQKTHLYCFPSPPVHVGPDGQAVNAGADGEEDTVELELLFTENDTNFMHLWGVRIPNKSRSSRTRPTIILSLHTDYRRVINLSTEHSRPALSR
ncbi:hypothetical protein EDB87DRAFT_120156 [Lactarius vividus]|nr:hypothetical protein EDB87DRAFT_120156 [Lactarius vividus]